MAPSVPDESLSLDLVAFIHLTVQLVLAVSGPRRPARGAELGVLSPGPGGLHAAPARHQARARLTVRGRHQQVHLGRGHGDFMVFFTIFGEGAF